MTRKAPVQFPLRRAYYLALPTMLRHIICAILVTEENRTQKRAAKWLGISQAQFSKDLSAFLFDAFDQQDVDDARDKLDNMRGPMFAGHY